MTIDQMSEPRQRTGGRAVNKLWDRPDSEALPRLWQDFVALCASQHATSLHRTSAAAAEARDCKRAAAFYFPL